MSMWLHNLPKTSEEQTIMSLHADHLTVQDKGAKRGPLLFVRPYHAALLY